MEIYAIVGETTQHMGKAPSGAILMVSKRPDKGYVARADGTWVKSSETLKAEALVRMNETLALGAEYKGVTYQCGSHDIDQFQRGLTMMDLGGLMTMECRAMDNSMHTLTDIEYRELCVTLGTTYETVLRTYWAEVDAIA